VYSFVSSSFKLNLKIYYLRIEKMMMDMNNNNYIDDEDYIRGKLNEYFKF
jgi:hypothetical protein